MLCLMKQTGTMSRKISLEYKCVKFYLYQFVQNNKMVCFQLFEDHQGSLVKLDIDVKSLNRLKDQVTVD